MEGIDHFVITQWENEETIGGEILTNYGTSSSEKSTLHNSSQTKANITQIDTFSESWIGRYNKFS